LQNELPRYGWFIRPEDVESHLRRLDANGVPHSDPVRTSEEGEAGTAIRFADPDDNQLEFWAPDRMPDGAMDGASPVGVGCISAAVFESRDLGKAADFYSRYCGLDPIRSADVGANTVVFPLAGAGRLVFKQVNQLGDRSLGRAVYRALHTALVVRNDEFLPTLERMYRELPEWDFDPNKLPSLTADEASAQSARTCIHGSPIGPEWKRRVGRGDSFCDWDNNGYHFVGAAPVGGSMVAFEPVSQRTYLEERAPAAANGSNE
jgi:extradiol dioxygenase family protein